MSIKIPHAHLFSELKKIGRELTDSSCLSCCCIGDEYHFSLLWPDGHTALVGLGAEASAVIANYAAESDQIEGGGEKKIFFRIDGGNRAQPHAQIFFWFWHLV